MADEDTVLVEAMDNLKEAQGTWRIRATQSLMRSQGMTSEAGENHRDLLTRLLVALAMTEEAYLFAPFPDRNGGTRPFKSARSLLPPLLRG